MNGATFDSPFVFLTFLAAPAILTNAPTVLALGTSNRLARAADRARAAASAILAARNAEDPLVQLQQSEFGTAMKRTQLLVQALRRFYLAAGCFAAGTCVALLGAFLDYLGVHWLDAATQVLTLIAALAGVLGLMHGALTLLQETRLALRALADQEAAISTWRAAHPLPGM